MSIQWIVVGDAAFARILARPSPDADLQEVEQLDDPAAHAGNAALRRDAYGRRSGDGDLRTGGNAMSSAGLDEEHRESIEFANRLADRLHEALQQRRFDELRIAADPRFLGHLRKALSPQVAAGGGGDRQGPRPREPARADAAAVFGVAAAGGAAGYAACTSM